MEQSIFKNYEHQVKDLDEAKGIVTIYINSFNNEDSDGDISLPGSFKKTFRENGKTIQHWLNHNWDKLIGVPIKLYEDDFGAVAVSQLNIKKQLGRDVFEDYKLFAEHDRTLQHSVRVWPVKFEEERHDDKFTRKVSEWKLIMEFSTIYGWGANQQTPLIDIKSLKGDLSDLELMMTEGNYSDEKSKLIEETYQKLKRLLLITEPQTTQDVEPEALKDEKVKFYSLLKF
jgi:HK97 family phage prohead protease